MIRDPALPVQHITSVTVTYALRKVRSWKLLVMKSCGPGHPTGALQGRGGGASTRTEFCRWRGERPRHLIRNMAR